MSPAQTDISDVVAKYWVISFGEALLLYGSEPSAQIAIGSSVQSKERVDSKSQLWSGSDLFSACHPLQIGHLMSSVTSYCLNLLYLQTADYTFCIYAFLTIIAPYIHTSLFYFIVITIILSIHYI